MRDCLFYGAVPFFAGKAVEALKIKKKDEKPMVIHRKAKPKVHEPFLVDKTTKDNMRPQNTIRYGIAADRDALIKKADIISRYCYYYPQTNWARIHKVNNSIKRYYYNAQPEKRELISCLLSLNTKD